MARGFSSFLFAQVVGSTIASRNFNVSFLKESSRAVFSRSGALLFLFAVIVGSTVASLNFSKFGFF